MVKPTFPMEKQVKIGHQRKNLYLSVVQSIKDYGKLPKRGGSKQLINYYTKKLSSEGIIKKIGYGTWVCDWQKWIEFKEVKQVKIGHDGTPSKSFTFHTQQRSVRGHGFQWILKIPIGLKNWDRRADFLRSRNISFSSSNTFRKGQSITIQHFKVWLCDKSLVFYFPECLDVLGESALKSREIAFIKLFEIVEALERLLNVSFKIVGKYYVRLVKQHYADPLNELAKKYDSEGKKLNVVGSDGKTWLLVDCSTGVPELECVHSQEAVKDMDEIVKVFFNDLRSNPVLLSDLVNMQTQSLANHLALSVIVKDLVKAVEIIKERL